MRTFGIYIPNQNRQFMDNILNYLNDLYPNSAPPLTGKMVPVMNRALSESRKTQASAITSPSGQ